MTLIERAVTVVNPNLLNEIVIYNNIEEHDEWDDNNFEFNICLLQEIKDLFKQIIGSISIECIKQELNPHVFGSFVFSQNLKPSAKLSLNRTSFKTQILVLKELGVFDLPWFDKVPLEQKGKFISRFLNMDFDNAKDYIGNIFDIKGTSGNKSPYNSTSRKQTNDLLSLIGLSLKK